MEYDHTKCQNDSLTCVGMEDTNFVYGLTVVPPTPGGYTPWSNWSICSTPNGLGSQSRQRNCTNPKPQFGGANCSILGPYEELRSCQLDPPIGRI